MSLRNWLRSWAEKGKGTGEGLRSWIQSWTGRKSGESGQSADTPKATGTGDTPGDWWGPNEDVALKGEWVQMSSTNVDEIRYLAAEKIIEVKFLNNYYYQYYDVPVQVFLDFLATDSPGRFVWNRLRYWHDYARIGAGAIPEEPTGNRTRKARVVRRLPAADDPEAIAREHAKRLRTDQTGTRRRQAWL